MKTDESVTPEDGKEDGKYVHLIGPARIEIIDGQLNIILLDDNRQDINRATPIVLGKHLLFVNMHVVAEFDEKQFAYHKDTFTQVKHAFVEFGLVNTPEVSIASTGSKFVNCMTSTDPPCSNVVLV